eukprot:gene19915-23868_t
MMSAQEGGNSNTPTPPAVAEILMKNSKGEVVDIAKVSIRVSTTLVCLGCSRTRSEIGGWGSRMTDDERDAILDDLPRRKALLYSTTNTTTTAASDTKIPLVLED